MKAEFLKSVHTLAQLPNSEKPEIILCGRSNVGKSSFINSFFNRRNLAQTSSTPGKTRSINFYDVENKFYFVDLPGFGYAKIGESEVKRWQKLIEGYIFSERDFLAAFHFVDSRHGMTKLDYLLHDFLITREIPIVIILSKADKLKMNEKRLAKKKILDELGDSVEKNNIFLYSATKKIGKHEVKRFVNSLIKK